MAHPRIFVSSTYYDLKHVRSSLDIFIESLGYESVLSEKGDIAYSPDLPLDESCYREVSSVDIFVLIIGGRYGSSAGNDGKRKSKEFYDRYESVTKKEFEEAIRRDIPVYVLVEASVHSEYQTYLRNKDRESVSYAHVDSVNIFRFIEQILSLPRNNPTKTFEKFSDIERWLKEQWAGLFRELLRRMAEQKRYIELSYQVEELKEINNTLKTYLESVIKAVSPNESEQLIERESMRLFNKSQKDVDEIIEELGPVQALNYAFATRNVKLVDAVLPLIKGTVDEDMLINAGLTQGSMLGSGVAFDYLEEVINDLDRYPTDKQIELLGCYVSGANRLDKESHALDVLGGFFNKIIDDESDLDPKVRASFLNQYQRLLNGEGKPEQALEIGKKVIELDPDDSSYLFNQSINLDQTGDIKGAVEYIQKALGSNPSDPDHFVKAIELFAKAGDRKLVLEYLGRLEKIEPLRAKIVKETSTVKEILKS